MTETNKLQPVEETIYVVRGMTGQYEDMATWLVAGFRNEQQANNFVTECTEEGNRIVNELHEKNAYYWNLNDEIKAGRIAPHKHDAKFTVVDSEFKYNITPLKLLEIF